MCRLEPTTGDELNAVTIDERDRFTAVQAEAAEFGRLAGHALGVTVGAEYNANEMGVSFSDYLADCTDNIAPLSGEMADTPTPNTLAYDLGVSEWSGESITELCDAYEDGFWEAFFAMAEIGTEVDHPAFTVTAWSNREGVDRGTRKEFTAFSEAQRYADEQFVTGGAYSVTIARSEVTR